jgi:transposase-like protein
MDTQDIIARYQAGATASHIAREIGCHRKTVLAVLKKKSQPVRKGRAPALPPATHADIIDMYRTGYSIAFLSRHYDVAPPTIRRILEEHNEPFRGKNTRIGQHCDDGCKNKLGD